MSPLAPPTFAESVIIGAGIACGVMLVQWLSKATKRLTLKLLPMRLHSAFCHCDRCMARESAEMEARRAREWSEP